MMYRSVSRAFGLSTLLLGACTIIHEPSNPPPPPPPPPGHEQPPPANTAATNPGTEGAKPKLSLLRLRPFGTKIPPAEAGDNLIVQVIDGTCVVKIDEQDYGDTASVNAKVTAGQHVVSCAPKEGDVQSHNVVVVEGGQPTTVIFSVKVAGESRVIPAPPVGRPETE